MIRIRSSQRGKLIVLLLFVTIVPFGSSILITSLVTRETVKDDFIEQNVNLLDLGKMHLERYLAELSGVSLSFYNNQKFMSYLRSSKESDYETFWTVRDELTKVMYAEESIDRVAIVLVEESRGISVSKSRVTFTRATADNEAFGKARASRNRMYIEPDPRGAGGFLLHRAIVDVPKNDLLAYLSIEVSRERVAEIADKLYSPNAERLYIATSDGTLVYRSDEVQAEPAWLERVLAEKEGRGTFEWNEGDFEGVVMYNRIPSAAGGWTLIKTVPYDVLFQNASSLARINLSLGAFGIVLAVLAALFVSFKITSPIRVLLENIRQIEKGKMAVDFESLGNDEIGVLGERFKQMIRRIDELITREYKLELENKTSQLKVLQSQINPHFLYNAFQSIGTLALKQGAANVYSLLMSLAQMMRYGMNTDEDRVALAKEAGHVEAYLLLQRERFGEAFEYEIDIDPAARCVPVPKMLLQPIAENYFKHGFEPHGGNAGRLRIEGRLRDGQLLLDVSDNGAGIAPDRMEELLRSFDDDRGLLPAAKRGGGRGPSGGIGLRNVRLRLRMYYDGDAALSLIRIPDGGLRVSIRIPAGKETGA